MENSKMNGYYYYQVRIEETLKGVDMDSINISVYLEEGFIDYVKSLPDDTKLIVFLINLYTRSGESDRDEFRNYIAGESYNNGIVVYSDTVYEEIVDEIKNQQIILHDKLYEYFPRDEDLECKIKGLIDDLTIYEKEMVAFDEIIAMGREAVPYIIVYMNDYRELPIKYARLFIDDPDWFEDIIQYSPELVIDTLGVILMGLVQTHFGNTWNNGTNEERQRALDGWRIYLYYFKGL
jgi:hypothetical protein